MAELSYNEALFQRTAQRFVGAVADERVNDIYKFTKEVALEFFKNGLAAGRRKSASRERSALRTTQSE